MPVHSVSCITGEKSWAWETPNFYSRQQHACPVLQRETLLLYWTIGIPNIGLGERSYLCFSQTVSKPVICLRRYNLYPPRLFIIQISLEKIVQNKWNLISHLQSTQKCKRHGEFSSEIISFTFADKYSKCPFEKLCQFYFRGQESWKSKIVEIIKSRSMYKKGALVSVSKLLSQNFSRFTVLFIYLEM